MHRDEAESRVRLWFFRDLGLAQSRILYRLFDVTEAEPETEATQLMALRHILDLLTGVTSDNPAAPEQDEIEVRVPSRLFVVVAQNSRPNSTGWRARMVHATNHDEAVGKAVRLMMDSEPLSSVSIPGSIEVSTDTVVAALDERTGEWKK